MSDVEFIVCRFGSTFRVLRIIAYETVLFSSLESVESPGLQLPPLLTGSLPQGHYHLFLAINPRLPCPLPDISKAVEAPRFGDESPIFLLFSATISE